MEKRQVGSVKWFNAEKGYGFLIGEDGQDVMVHHSVIRMEGFRTLKPEQVVSYTAVTTEKGMQATEVWPDA